MPRLSKTVILNSAVFFTAIAFSCCCCSTVARDGLDDLKRTQSKTLTVCQLLNDTARYHGSIVTVTGVYWSGLREICKEPVLARNYTKEAALNLTHSSASRPGPFTTDPKSWDQLMQFVIEEARAKRKEEIWVTVRGLFEAQPLAGYGHLGVFPAQLIVQRVIAVHPKAVPTYDYSLLLRPAA